jgi:tryptophan halogenase
MNNLSKNIVVLGSGTSGLISALMFKNHFPNFNVKVVASKNIGIIGVGEGSTEHWRAFCERIGVTIEETIVECGATLKSAIKFHNWGVPDYLHNVVDTINVVANEQYAVYAHIISNGGTTADMNMPATEAGLIETAWPEGKVDTPVNQLHFNTFKTNEYLLKKCSEHGITVVDDVISDLLFDSEGGIAALIGEKSQYLGDFFIDCSGFSRVIMNKLGANWQSHSDHLWANSAIAFPTEDTDEYPVYTKATAMDYGWMWNTPVLGRWGNGYVFCDKYIDFDQAQAEVEKYLGRPIEVFKKIKFDAGRIDKFWIKNCVAVGVAGSFVEPLESSAISQTILQTFLCMNLFPAWINGQDDVSDFYNTRMDDMYENILDFICLHYVVPREDTPFWKDLKQQREQWIPDSLKSKIKSWTRRLPTNIEFNKYLLFTGDNWIMTMHALGLLDVEAIKSEYAILSEQLKRDCAARALHLADLYKYLLREGKYMPHKQALELFIKNYKEGKFK